MPAKAPTAHRPEIERSEVIVHRPNCESIDATSLAEVLEQLLASGAQASNVVVIRLAHKARVPDPATQRSGQTQWKRLTPRQRTVAGLVARAFTNRQIAKRMRVSEHTVNYHLRQIFITLGIGSRVELAQLVHDEGAEKTDA